MGALLGIPMSFSLLLEQDMRMELQHVSFDQVLAPTGQSFSHYSSSKELHILLNDNDPNICNLYKGITMSNKTNT